MQVRRGPHSKPDSRNEPRPSGCQVVDVEFRPPIPEIIGCVTFQNHYTHSLTLKYWSKRSGQISNLKPDHPAPGGEWRVGIRNLQLMPNCHCERGSQSLVILNKAHFMAPLENVSRLRLILRQPSPDWIQFGVKDLNCYSVSDPFHRNGNTGMRPTPTSAKRMEQILQNGLWTKTDVESEPRPKRHPYNITVLPHT